MKNYVKERGSKTGISHCWHCTKQLVRKPGGFIFAEVADPDGRRMRVHKDCQPRAVGDGYKAVT